MAADGNENEGQADAAAREAAATTARSELLKIQHTIRVYESHLKTARRRRKQAITSVTLGPMLLVFVYVGLWLPWISAQVKLIGIIPVGGLAIGLLVAAVKLFRSPGGPKVRIQEGSLLEKRETEDDLLLKIAKQRDTKKLKITQGSFDLRTRQYIYKDDSYSEIEKLRTDSKNYRRVNNVFQAVLIIGSSTAAAAAAFSYSLGALRWVAAIISLIVTISTGFVGYYKYKERSFYLQQTADSIEHEWQAFEVGGGRYRKYVKDKDEVAALNELVEELLRLNSEQKKRQQNLEQPPDTHGKQDD